MLRSDPKFCSKMGKKRAKMPTSLPMNAKIRTQAASQNHDENLARAIDAKDQVTQSHIRRVQVYAAGLAKAAGLSTADIAGGMAPKAAAEKLAAFAKGSVLVGHNLGFDVAFLDEALGAGRTFAVEAGTYLDTHLIFREAYPESESFKLGDLARTYGTATTPNHRALPDAEATAELLIFAAADLPARLATLQPEVLVVRETAVSAAAIEASQRLALVVQAGADTLVAGTAVFGAPDYAAAIAGLRRARD